MTDDVDRDDATRDASGAYALGALTARDRAAFEKRLIDDEQLRTETTELSDTAVALGLSVAPELPSASLRDRVLAAVAASPQLVAPEPVARDAVGERAEGTEAAPNALDPIETPASRAPAGTPAEVRARASWWRRPAALALAASAAVLLVLGGVSVATSLHTSQVDAAGVSQIQNASDSRRATSDVAGGGTATVVWSAHADRAGLVLHGASVPSADRVYQLWYIRDGRAVSAGTFRPDSDGDASVVLSGDLQRGATVGVTVEPKGGSSSPTTTPVVAIPLGA